MFHNCKTFIAIEKNKVLGRIDVVLIPSHFDGSIRGYLDWIYVLKDYRHQGIAQLLLNKAITYLKEKNACELFCQIAQNDEAQRFYKSIPNVKINHDEMLTLSLS